MDAVKTKSVWLVWYDVCSCCMTVRLVASTEQKAQQYVARQEKPWEYSIDEYKIV